MSIAPRFLIVKDMNAKTRTTTTYYAFRFLETNFSKTGLNVIRGDSTCTLRDERKRSIFVNNYNGRF